MKHSNTLRDVGTGVHTAANYSPWKVNPELQNLKNIAPWKKGKIMILRNSPFWGGVVFFRGDFPTTPAPTMAPCGPSLAPPRPKPPHDEVRAEPWKSSPKSKGEMGFVLKKGPPWSLEPKWPPKKSSRYESKYVICSFLDLWGSHRVRTVTPLCSIYSSWFEGFNFN